MILQHAAIIFVWEVLDSDVVNEQSPNPDSVLYLHSQCWPPKTPPYKCSQHFHSCKSLGRPRQKCRIQIPYILLWKRNRRRHLLLKSIYSDVKLPGYHAMQQGNPTPIIQNISVSCTPEPSPHPQVKNLQSSTPPPSN